MRERRVMQSERQTRHDETRDATNDESIVYCMRGGEERVRVRSVGDEMRASGEWGRRGRERSETRRGGRE